MADWRNNDVGINGMAPAYERNLTKHKIRYKLVVCESDLKGEVVDLHRPQLFIGRSRLADISHSDRDISNHHAIIVMDAKGFFVIRDLKSSTGTWVNGEKVQMKKLANHDVIKIGPLVFMFVLVNEDKFSLREFIAGYEKKKGEGAGAWSGYGNVKFLNPAHRKVNPRDAISIPLYEKRGTRMGQLKAPEEKKKRFMKTDIPYLVIIAVSGVLSISVLSIVIGTMQF